MSLLKLYLALNAPPDFQTQPNLEFPARQARSGILKPSPRLLNREFAAIPATYSLGQENFGIEARSETRRNLKDERSYGIVMKVESYFAGSEEAANGRVENQFGDEAMLTKVSADHKAATAA